MNDPLGTTVLVGGIIQKMQAGDSHIRTQLIEHACNRLRAMIARQIRSFPRVHRWDQTDDVLQNVLLRLWRALETVDLQDAKHFFALSASLIRRELIDLSRHHFGPQGDAAHHHTNAGMEKSGERAVPDVAGTDTYEPGQLAQWTEFHAHVETMSPELREVVDLLWYQELPQEEVAELLGTSAKTIQRRWREARLELGELLTA